MGEVRTKPELHYQLSLAKRLEFISEEKMLTLEPIVIETEKVLGSLIRSNRKRKGD
ncbi:hypothetical protein DSCO28_34100 [Desulfosarcina ovata subsp. sediminis]|uniref:Four helix bundle protein n=1 Tax=Desulfosarcina ovata subsp. sediminis TaxID=885957 RepID=A0A5K7ZMP6_9BACT|nr:hypothetical protein DSCO28_34100 [Desulfosarcina ovata subsp. sediminis]